MPAGVPMKTKSKRSTRMSEITLGKVNEKKLPNIAHYFSTLVFHNETYFELNGKFHGRYPSSVLFRNRWRYGSRLFNSGPAAIRVRTIAVLKRADVSVIRYRYMTSVCWSGAMRHVSAVEISDNDFDFLLGLKMLRELHQASANPSAEEIIRKVIYGLLPVAMRLEKSAA